MKKRNVSQKLRIQKSKIASFDRINAVHGGFKSNPCDSIETMQCTVLTCPSDGCPPGSLNCPPQTVTCPPPPTGNTRCVCDSIITMAGVTGC